MVPSDKLRSHVHSTYLLLKKRSRPTLATNASVLNSNPTSSTESATRKLQVDQKRTAETTVEGTKLTMSTASSVARGTWCSQPTRCQNVLKEDFL